MPVVEDVGGFEGVAYELGAPAAAINDLTAYWHSRGGDTAQVRTDLTC
ncbi:hypothetical protein [Streptomyces nodosus]